MINYSSLHKTCDLCGAECFNPADLRPRYRTKDIKIVCDDCGKEINSHLDKLLRFTENIKSCFLKKFLVTMQKKIFKKQKQGRG